MKHPTCRKTWLNNLHFMKYVILIKDIIIISTRPFQGIEYKQTRSPAPIFDHLFNSVHGEHQSTHFHITLCASSPCFSWPTSLPCTQWIPLKGPLPFMPLRVSYSTTSHLNRKAKAWCGMWSFWSSITVLCVRQKCQITCKVEVPQLCPVGLWIPCCVL